MNKYLNWSVIVLIYCLENGNAKISRSDIAKSLGLSINQYNSLLKFLKYTSVYKLAKLYVNKLNNRGSYEKY